MHMRLETLGSATPGSHATRQLPTHSGPALSASHHPPNPLGPWFLRSTLPFLPVRAPPDAPLAVALAPPAPLAPPPPPAVPRRPAPAPAAAEAAAPGSLVWSVSKSSSRSMPRSSSSSTCRRVQHVSTRVWCVVCACVWTPCSSKPFNFASEPVPGANQRPCSAGPKRWLPCPTLRQQPPQAAADSQPLLTHRARLADQGSDGGTREAEQ